MIKLMLLLIVPGLLSAITYRKTHIDDLIKSSSLIIEGKIEAQNAYWLDGKIYTDFSVLVTDAYKGAAQKVVTVRVLGGRVADKELIIHGMPQINTGDSTLLFLVTRDGKYTLHSLAMGYFNIDKDKNYYNRAVSNKILLSDTSSSKYPGKPVLQKSQLIHKISSLTK